MQPPYRPDQQARYPSHGHVEQQNAFQLLPFQLKPPSEQASHQDRQSRDRRDQEVVIACLLQRSPPGQSARPVESNSRNEQGDWEVHQHDMLRVLGQQNRFRVKYLTDAGHCTTTLPVILGWTEQKYGYVPGLVKVKENFSSVSSTLDLKTLSSLTTVCGMSSRLVHVTVVPTATVSVDGPKLKLSILTSALDTCVCSARTAKVLELLADSDTARTTGAKTKLHTLLLMTFLPLYFCR